MRTDQASSAWWRATTPAGAEDDDATALEKVDEIHRQDGHGAVRCCCREILAFALELFDWSLHAISCPQIVINNPRGDMDFPLGFFDPRIS
ncbi:hypothetical protein ACLB1E_25530 [Escherichia coli]